jgi:hypothetical protein
MIERIVLRSEPSAPLELAPLPREPGSPPSGARGLRPPQRRSRWGSSLLLPGYAGRWALLRAAEGASLLLIASVFAVAAGLWLGAL